MMARPPKETLVLDMPFEEALERYEGVTPKELERSVARARKKELEPLKGKKRKLSKSPR